MATAPDPTPYLTHWKAWDRRANEARRQAEARARAALEEAVTLLRERGARTIRLIGSLARGRFEPNSDVDLLVTGLDDSACGQVATELAERTGVAFDVVRAEALSAGWRRHHERYGELLHA